MKSIVLINGKRSSRLSVFDRSTQFGDGLFETMVIRQGNLEFWQAHFARLERGRMRLKIAKVSARDWLADITRAYQLSKLDNAVVKIMLTRGQSQRGYGFDRKIKPNAVVIVSPLVQTPEVYQLDYCHSGYGNNPALAGIKHSNRLEQVLARTDLIADECIMLDDQQQVISVSQGNIFCIKDGVLSTPDLKACGIEGTMRDQVLKLAPDLGLSVNIGSISQAQLQAADEVFISNSIIGVKPVVCIGDQTYKPRIAREFAQALDRVRSRQLTPLIPPKYRLKKLLLLLAIVLGIYAYALNQVGVEKTTIYEVKPGANAHSVAKELEQLDYIRSATYAKYLSKILGVDQLKRGFYEITPEMSLYQLFDNLSSAQVAQRDITLIEGQTVEQYFQMLSQNPAISVEYDFAQTMRLSGAKAPYDGQFWPDTYRINYGDSLVDLLSRARQIMQTNLQKAWQGRAKDHPLDSAQQALVLASLIERESAHQPEKAKIAGVFISRLQKGMRLQTDPSVVYALGDRYQGRLKKADLKFDSPYNTYRHKGLPPGAIGAVGADSLQAAMHPHVSGDLYFVSKKDGTHAFAKTYQQHKNNIQKYLK